MNIDQERANYENHTWDYYQRLKTAGWSHSDEGDSSSREALFWRAGNGQYGVRQLEAAWRGWLMRAALVPQALAYCEPCQRVGMSNCSDFVNCGQARCVTCHQRLPTPKTA